MSEAHPGCFDRVADVYDATRGLPPQAEASSADALAQIFRRAGERPHVLEVGVGTGRIALPLSSRGCRVTGIDISRSMLTKLRAKAGGGAIQATLASAMHLPLRRDACDGALFVHVLHLVPDASRVIHQALGVVRGGGVLAFAGEDLFRSPLALEVRSAMREAIREVTGLELGGSGGHARVLQSILEEFARVGRPVERVELARWESPASGRGWMRQLEGKAMSWMWPIPDVDLPSVVERVRPRMIELCGDLDRPHTIARSMSALVAQLQ